MTPASEHLEALALKAAAILREEGATEVYLFGSAAEGRAREDSDLDLAVRGLPERVYFRALARAAHAIGRNIDLVTLDTGSPFGEFILSRGRLRRVG